MTANLTSTQTFLQKLLGRNYKWWYLFLYTYKQSMSGVSSFIFDNLFSTVEFFTILYIWLYNKADPVIITYLCLGYVFNRIVASNFGGVLASHIVNGSITKDLIRPQSTIIYYYVSNLGYNTFRYLVSAILTLLLASVFFSQYIIFSGYPILFVILLIPISITIRYFFSFLVGCLGFWLGDKQNTNSVINGVYTFSSTLSGKLIPLNLIFLGSFSFLQFSPFAFTLHIPMQIYLGKYSPTEILYVFLGGITWCVVLYFLAKWVFKLGLKRNESVGL